MTGYAAVFMGRSFAVGVVEGSQGAGARASGPSRRPTAASPGVGELLRGRQAHARVEAAVARLVEPDLSPVGLDEALHDREPEPGAAAARPRLPEAVEGVRSLLRGEAGAAVDDVHLD